MKVQCLYINKGSTNKAFEIFIKCLLEVTTPYQWENVMIVILLQRQHKPSQLQS